MKLEINYKEKKNSKNNEYVKSKQHSLKQLKEKI